MLPCPYSPHVQAPPLPQGYLEKTGLLDEIHFAYLEDVDLGYRARILGYKNCYEPTARVYHAGSATTGSRYNPFKIAHSSRNNIYLIYKNMPFFQLLLNLPFLAAGFFLKILFFCAKGYGAYTSRAWARASDSAQRPKPAPKSPFQTRQFRALYNHTAGTLAQHVPPYISRRLKKHTNRRKNILILKLSDNQLHLNIRHTLASLNLLRQLITGF